MSIEVKSFKEYLDLLIQAKNGDQKARHILQKTSLGQNYTTNADGGYALPSELIDAVMNNPGTPGWLYDKATHLQSRSRSTTVPVLSSGYRTYNNGFDGLMGYWLDESQTKNESSVQYGSLPLVLNKLAIVTDVSDEFRDDIENFDEFYARKVAEAFRFYAQHAMMYGTGTTMTGILSSTAAVSVTVSAEPNFKASLQDFVAHMAPECYGNANWYMSTNMYMKCVDTGIVDHSVANEDQPFGTILGRPVFILDSLVDGDIAFVDPSQYIVVEGRGKQTVSTDVKFLEDQTVVRNVFRINGAPGWMKPRIQEDGKQVSPFVVRSAASQIGNIYGNTGVSCYNTTPQLQPTYAVTLANLAGDDFTWLNGAHTLTHNGSCDWTATIPGTSYSYVASGFAEEGFNTEYFWNGEYSNTYRKYADTTDTYFLLNSGSPLSAALWVLATFTDELTSLSATYIGISGTSNPAASTWADGLLTATPIDRQATITMSWDAPWTITINNDTLSTGVTGTGDDCLLIYEGADNKNVPTGVYTVSLCDSVSCAESTMCNNTSASTATVA